MDEKESMPINISGSYTANANPTINSTNASGVRHKQCNQQVYELSNIGQRKNKYQNYKKIHVYQDIHLTNGNQDIVNLEKPKKIFSDTQEDHFNSKPPLPPKPKFICKRSKRHIYYTIDFNEANKPVLKSDGKDYEISLGKKVEKTINCLEPCLSSSNSINNPTNIPPPLPPRILNVEAIKQRNKLNEEYFKDLRKSVDNDLLNLADESDLPVANILENNETINEWRNKVETNGESSSMNVSEDLNVISHDDSGGIHNNEVSVTSKSNTSFAQSIKALKICGWYWGNLSWTDAESILNSTNTTGAFLIRDSHNDKHLLTVTVRSAINTIHHIRIEHVDGKFQLYEPGRSVNSNAAQCVRHSNIIKFVDLAIRHSQLGNFAYFVKPKNLGEPPIQICLLVPISRYSTMKSLKYYCRLVLRDRMVLSSIKSLPLPSGIIDYLVENPYYDPKENYL